MKTSCFFTYQGPGGISIARRAPKLKTPFLAYRQLAPGSWFKSVSPEEYVLRYTAEILDKLSHAQVYFDLVKLAHPHEPVLLCWEQGKPNDDQFWCHRRLVARWFEEKFVIKVPEV